MQRQEAVEHGGEKIEPARRPGLLIEGQRDVEPAAKAAIAGAGSVQAGDARTARPGCDAEQRADRGARFAGLPAVIETQDLAQGIGGGLAADDAEMSQRQVRDQSPEAL